MAKPVRSCVRYQVCVNNNPIPYSSFIFIFINIMQTPAFLSSLLAGSSFASGAIAVWLLGIASFMLRRVPTKLWAFAKTYFVVSVDIRIVGSISRNLANDVFDWYMASPNSKRLRVFSLESTSDGRAQTLRRSGYYAKNTDSGSGKNDDIRLSPGMSTNVFFFQGRLGWLSRTAGQSSAGESANSKATISFLGHDKAIIERFIKTVRPERTEEAIDVYGFNARRNDWELTKTRKKRPLSSVVMPEKTRSFLLKTFDAFYDSKAWYETRGIMYKMTVLLHGAPGTGKSSLIFALASHYQRNIYMINVNSIGEDDFIIAMNTIPENTIIVLEDVDVSSSTGERTALALENESNSEETTNKHQRSKLSMSTLLNALDGIASMENNIVMITTNHLDKLDAALTRRGRVDHIVEINPLSDGEIRAYIKLMYPQANLAAYPGAFAPHSGCEMQACFLEHRHDVHAFICALQAPLEPSILTLESA